MKNICLMVAAALFTGLLATLFGPAPSLHAQGGGGAPAPCWCCVDYTVTPSDDCDCTLYIDNGIIAAVNCAILGNPNCPVNSTKKCALDADFREDAPCGGFYPDIVINTKCESTKSVDTPDCDGNSSEHHTITLICNACTRIPGGCPP